jgi:predicted aldo/keto reductase-like oxidoreductase
MEFESRSSQNRPKKLRFIGISGHARPPQFVKMLQTGQIDVVMPVVNYADRNIYNFEAMAYALDLEGVGAAVVGPFTLEQAIQNIEFARSYRPLNETERKELLAFGQELPAKLGPRYSPVA